MGAEYGMSATWTGFQSEPLTPEGTLASRVEPVAVLQRRGVLARSLRWTIVIFFLFSQGISGGWGNAGMRTHVACVDASITCTSSDLGTTTESFVGARFVRGGGVGALVYFDNPWSGDSCIGVVSWIDRASALGSDGSNIWDCLSNGRNGRHCKEGA